jgi:hypothetical protein
MAYGGVEVNRSVRAFKASFLPITETPHADVQVSYYVSYSRSLLTGFNDYSTFAVDACCDKE